MYHIIRLLKRYKKTGSSILIVLLLVYGFNGFYGLSWRDYRLFWFSPDLYIVTTQYESEILGGGTFGYLFAGIPEYEEEKKKLRIIKNAAYWVGYDTKSNTPKWVSYRLNRNSKRDTVTRPENFIADFRVLPPTSPSIYTRTGYDRGHMAPNYAISTFFPKHVDSTFLMSNIVPQKPDLNRRVWQRLEMAIAKDYVYRYKELWVIMGPIYVDKYDKIRHIPIPEAFFKIIVAVTDNNEVKMIAFRIPQDVKGDESLEQFITNVGMIENEIGINLMPDLPEKWKIAKYMTYRKVW